MSLVALRKIREEKKNRTGRLNLFNLELKKIPKKIMELDHLVSLGLSHNRISDVHFLEKFISLQTLSLGHNQISDIRFLEKFISLQTLYLSSNQISDYSLLENMVSLRTLYLSNNRISDSRFLGDMVSLQTLHLDNNQIKDVRFVEKLVLLQYLNLSHNQISDISSLLGVLKKGKLVISLKETASYGTINLYGNPIETPPLEIIKKGTPAIIKYLEELRNQGEDELYEAKLLIVGEGGSGKTTLARKIKNKNAKMPNKETERTEGIDILPVEIKNIKKEKQYFQMNIWDFGGQEIYHATHQFFLTKRSLYIIVNNTRMNATDFNYWLQIISLWGGDSPVIIVQNQEADSPTGLDIRGLKAQFPNIIDVLDVDLSKPKEKRFEKLMQSIRFNIQQLKHVGSPLPKQWVKIRELLNEESKTKDFISDAEFVKICKANKIKEKDRIKTLGSFLHDLGVFLHFSEDPILKRTIILKNTWATKGVYQILDHKEIQKNKGHFSRDEVMSLCENSDYDDRHDELLSLMKKFELCYKIRNIKEEKYVSPQLLSKEKPDYEWNGENNLVIYYEYDFMPKGLLSRLVVRLYKYIKDIDQYAWRTGCIFTFEGSDAQVIETYGNKKIVLRIIGNNSARLSTIITEEIDVLNSRFENLEIKKLIPCNCRECKESKNPHLYTYENLMNRRINGRATVECDKSYEFMNVEKLMNGFFDQYSTDKKIVESLISQNKIGKALEQFSHSFSKEAILLKMRYNFGKNDNLLGLTNREDWSVERVNVAHAMLEFLKLNS